VDGERVERGKALNLRQIARLSNPDVNREFAQVHGNGWLLQEIKTRLSGREWAD
jgi:hypothetical protein